MASSEPTTLIEHFAPCRDPRLVKKTRHILLDVVVMAIKECLVTIDAIGCQKAIAQQKGYNLRVKRQRLIDLSGLGVPVRRI